jgi:predicted ABC-type ATPase
MLKTMPRKATHLNCYIIAGPNGAGKTTFATEFLPVYANCRNFINADLLARAYSPFDPDAGMLRAGRTVLERIAKFTGARTDFAFETTLSGRTYMPLLRGVKKAGFRLHMFYLWIPSPRARRSAAVWPDAEQSVYALPTIARHPALFRQFL